MDLQSTVLRTVLEYNVGVCSYLTHGRRKHNDTGKHKLPVLISYVPSIYKYSECVACSENE